MNKSDDETRATASFTSWKLDLIDAMLIDPRLRPSDFRVAVAILQFVNAETGQCNPAQETLAELVNVTPRTIETCIANLRESGWLAWERGNRQRSNCYAFDDRNVDAMLDRRTSIDDARRDRFAARLTRNKLRLKTAPTRSTLPLSTRSVLPVPIGSRLPGNTLEEHHIGTPLEVGTERRTTTPPNFDKLDTCEDVA